MNHVVDIGDNYYCCSGHVDLKMKVNIRKINIKKMNRNNGKNKLHHMHVSNMPKLHMCHIALMERNLHWFIK